MNIRHFGIQSLYFDKSIKFYKKLGFKIVYEETENWEGSFGEIKVVKMRLDDDNMLFEITEKYCNDNYYVKPFNYCHMAIGVNDIKKTLRKINNKTTPIISPSGSALIAFIEDPNGFKIELVEII